MVQLDGQQLTLQQIVDVAHGKEQVALSEEARLRVQTDPHAPEKYRVMGPLSNMPDFAKAFECEEGAPMVRPAADVCTVW